MLSYAVRRPSQLGLLLLVLGACSPTARVTGPASASDRAADPATPVAENARPSTQRVGRTIVTPNEAIGIEELFERARAALMQGDALAAATGFDRVVELDPDGPLCAAALFHAARAHEEQGDREAAAHRFSQVARRFPKHELAREALLRATRLLVFLEDYAPASRTAQALEERYSPLGIREQVVVLSARALQHVQAQDADAASRFVEKARTIIEHNRLDLAGEIPRDLAQVYFALGEVRRLRGEAIVFEPVPEDFSDALERRCQLLLDAQRAYSDTMRAHDSHWSAMAGFRVGELYARLHTDLMSVTPPSSASTDDKQALFEGAMRLRYSILLDKGLAMMEQTLSMAARTGETSAWVARATQAKRQLQEAVRKERAALARLPYSRPQLQQALKDLASRPSQKSTP